MIPLVIAGAGGLARETVDLVAAINALSPTFDLLGMLDDDPACWGPRPDGSAVLGPLEWVQDHPDVAVVVCLAAPSTRELRSRVVARLDLDDDRFATLVHPAASIGRSVVLGAGCVVHAGVVFTAAVEVGRHVAVMPNVVLTHDDIVADAATFGAGACLAGGVHVGPSAYVGAGALVREGVVIGAGAMVAMGAVVTRDVPPGEVWAGVPARPQPMTERQFV